MLNKVQNKLKDHKFIYLNAEDLPKGFSIEDELKNKRDFFDKITFRQTPRKTPVLLIDEFQATDPNIVLEAKGKWEKKKKGVKSIVIAQIARELHNASGSFKERIGNRIITLKGLSDATMKEILKRRLDHKGSGINYYDKLHEDTVDLLVKHADSNPRRLLEYADSLFDFHYRKFQDINPILKKEYMISYYAARDILAEKDIIQEIKSGKREKSIDFYTAVEKKIMRFIRKNDISTAADIASRFKMTRNKASGLVSSLKKKGAIIYAGKRNNMQQWELSPGMKRILVKT
ncbi:hypothetical protein COT47_07530 [Candidatus Woesearchaeota archaeon CG08_land_8_20_14_0_20_43_7]|nr:MAG: hypothetical protein COT47_07530 [Candidatus Woesearchaeota archaeon CG08_land_8_20_14_0_20_43_7]